MSVPERPQIRPYLVAQRSADSSGAYFIVHDRLRLSDATVSVSALELEWARLFDGSRTLREAQAEAIRNAGGLSLPLDGFVRLARRLDAALFLDGPRFRAAIAAPIRQPTCIGVYPAEPAALRQQFQQLFTGPGGPGAPKQQRPDNSLRAALVPHIDYGRGGRTFAYGFKEVFERTAASLFVIIGTSHYSPHRFTLTRQHFRTPLGVVPTDQHYIDRLVSRYGDGLFDDPLAHLPEHSIELEVVLLQYLYEGNRPIRIVPLLVGPFGDCIRSGQAPVQFPDIARMVEALRAVEKDTAEPICYLISGDLAHIGPKFSDPAPVTPAQLDHCKRQDFALLERTTAIDPLGYFRIIADEDDSRRICGLPPTYTVLEALRPAHGKVLHYDQYVHPKGHESVSFASVAFYG